MPRPSRQQDLTPAEVQAWISARLPGFPSLGLNRDGPCPIHQGDGESFAINAETGLWNCKSACDRGGTLLQLEREIGGHADNSAAWKAICEAIGRPTRGGSRRSTGGRAHLARTDRPAADQPAERDTTDAARKVWAGTLPIADDDPPRTYLAKRGITVPLPADLRLARLRHPKDGGIYPVMVAAVRDLDGNLHGVSRTYLADDGQGKADLTEGAAKMFLGKVRGRAVQLAPAGPRLAIAEGIESALSVMQAVPGLPAWAALSAGGIEDLELPVEVLELLIITDQDDSGVGEEAARKAAQRFAREGRQVRIVRPPVGKDANDVLTADGPSALAALICAAETFEPEPEAAPKATIPEEFDLRNNGLYHKVFDKERGDDWHWVSGRIEVLAVTRSEESRDWGKFLSWRDPDGHEHRWSMPSDALAGDGRDVLAYLMNAGLRIAQGKAAKDGLLRYLGAVDHPTRARSVIRTGWADGRFVFPDGAIGPDGSEMVVYQALDACNHAYRTAGTLQAWQTTIGMWCLGNSRLAFAVAMAFAAPLLEVTGEESGGVHYFGGTSQGKTTAIDAAGSVWGGGPRGFKRTWRATINGLEGVAATHNDALLLLDEIAQVDPGQAGDVAYMLGNGQGKARGSRASNAVRPTATWRTLYLSTGEITLADHMAAAGKVVRGGQAVRVLNIPADAGAGYGLFEYLHGEASGDAFSRRVVETALRNYGTPIREYLRCLADCITTDSDGLIGSLKGQRAAFNAAHLPVGASGEVARACGRFSLIAAAGELAAHWGILPWPSGEASKAAATCFAAWLASRGGAGSTDAEAVVATVRGYIEQHGPSRFAPLTDPDNIGYRPRVGFRVIESGAGGETETTAYLFLPQAFKEAMKGYDLRTVKRVLCERGFLTLDPDGKPPKHHRPKGWPSAPRVYPIDSAILEC